MEQAIEHDSANPMDFKKRLAHELVAEFHDANAAGEAERHFQSTVQRGETPEDVPAFRLVSASSKRLGNVLVEAQLASSNTEAKRLIDQNAVTVNGEPVTDNVPADTLASGDLVRAGRRRIVRIERRE
jgi:tyrosyl-tRNA synthetase